MKKSLLPLFIIAIFWHLLCYLTIVDPAFFPTPLSIFKNTFMLLSRDHLLIQVYYSLKRLIIAFGLSAPLAIVLAMVVAHFKKIDDFINPIVAFTFPLPKVALYPLLLLIFGIDDLSKIALIGVGIFYLIFIYYLFNMLTFLFLVKWYTHMLYIFVISTKYTIIF